MIYGIMLVLSIIGFVTGNPLWIGHGIYEFFQPESTFFGVFFSHLLYWVIHMLVSFVLFGVAGVGIENGTKRK